MICWGGGCHIFVHALNSLVSSLDSTLSPVLFSCEIDCKCYIGTVQSSRGLVWNVNENICTKLDIEWSNPVYDLKLLTKPAFL